MRVLVLLACLAYAASQECGPLQGLKVKHEWSQVFSVGEDRERFAREVFTEFFRMEPDSRAKFARVRGDNAWSPVFVAHALRVLGGLDMTISLLSERPLLYAALAHLKTQHDARDVTPHEFQRFGEALAHVMFRNSAQHYDLDAWKACINDIVTGILGN